MKTMATQLSLILRIGQQTANLRLLIKFCLILTFFFVVYSVLFHMIMLYEGRQYSWITGFYWTLTTMSTLGFGDITFNSDMGKFFSILVLLSGIIFLLVMLPFTFIQFFYAPWLEEQNKARAPRSLPEDVSGHIIFTHFGEVTRNLIHKLNQYGIAYVILEPDLQTALNIHDQGYRTVVGDLDDPNMYHRLNIRKAALVVVMNDDMTSTNIIFTIRENHPDVITVTNADVDESLDILELAGSTHVLQFTKMLGQSLARRVRGTRMKSNIIGRFSELLIAEVPAMRTWLQGKTLAQTRLRQVAGVTVVGMWEQGRFLIPGPGSIITETSVLLLAGTETQLEQFDNTIVDKTKTPPEKGPVVVLGGGRVGMAVAGTLKDRGVDFRVVEKKPRIASMDMRYIHGNAADLDILVEAGIHDTPAVIITTHDDNLNIYLTIYCRRLRPDVQIISRASLDRNINTLHRAGANLVMSFSSLVTTTILNLLQPQKMLMLSEGLNVFRTPLNHRLENKSLLDIQIRENTGCSVVAIKRGGDLIINPDPAIVLEPEDELVMIGTAESEKTFTEKYPAPVKQNSLPQKHSDI